MSYCRFSCDNFKSDVYVYESNAGFECHVATSRYLLPDDAPNPTFELLMRDAEEFTRVHAERSKLLETVECEPIGLPQDGESVTLDSAGEMLGYLTKLKTTGYHIPDHALESLREEIPK